MRRLTRSTMVILAILMATAMLAPSVAAQDPEQPIVGTWFVDDNLDDPTNALGLAVFHADGSFIEVTPEGIGMGAWRPAGDGSVELTIKFPQPGEDGSLVGFLTVRVSVTVDASGMSFTAPYTLEFVSPDGGTTGQLGPGTASGTRIVAEPMGEPVGPIPMPPSAGE